MVIMDVIRDTRGGLKYLWNACRYLENDEKSVYTGGYGVNPYNLNTTYRQMVSVRQYFEKTSGNPLMHFIISFDETVHWLESVPREPNFEELNHRIEVLEERISEIDSILNNESIKDRTISALSLIQTDMTNWADSLEMKYRDHPYRIDISRTTVVVDTNRPVVLREMGSASNWLGAHLISMFGLHKYFIMHDRPVPSFLFLDQPSQVYFPEGSAEEDMDIKAVEGIYDYIFNRVSENSGKLQVIIVDHAKLETEEFKVNTIEEWRNQDNNLISVDWYQ